MPVELTAVASSGAKYEKQYVIGAGSQSEPASNLPLLLEKTFDEVRQSWWEIGKKLGDSASALLALMPSCVANTSDFGLMLAWTKLVDTWTEDPARILVVCKDPWLFRHLAMRAGVDVISKPPPLLGKELYLRLRGLAARLAASFRFANSAWRMRGQQKPMPSAASLLVYGHPRSTANGEDAYFGHLMQELPWLQRMLHVDAQPARAKVLQADKRSFSLHGFGSVFFALTLWATRWKARARGEYAWLVRRAVSLEGSTAQAAAVQWQIHCQERWLRKTRPKVVCWPWENHGWERALARSCRRLGIRTIGYQHATVGWREWNYSPISNPDGDNSLPDKIFCVGKKDMARLAAYGCDPKILSVAGALRYGAPVTTTYDAKSPIFVALPFDPVICSEMVAALSPLAKKGQQFLIKDHPMSPFEFAESANLQRTDRPLGAQKSVSGVFYCITTVGLEALLAGLPVLRFLPASKVAVDIAPDGVAIPAAAAPDLEAALRQLVITPAPDRTEVFATPDIALWKSALGCDAC